MSILELIRKCTITKAHRQTKNKEFCLTNDEFLAFIAVMYAREVTGSNDMPYHTLCTKAGAFHCAKKQYQEIVSAKFTFSSL